MAGSPSDSTNLGCWLLARLKGCSLRLKGGRNQTVSQKKSKHRTYDFFLVRSVILYCTRALPTPCRTTYANPATTSSGSACLLLRSDILTVRAASTPKCDPAAGKSGREWRARCAGEGPPENCFEGIESVPGSLVCSVQQWRVKSTSTAGTTATARRQPPPAAPHSASASCRLRMLELRSSRRAVQRMLRARARAHRAHGRGAGW